MSKRPILNFAVKAIARSQIYKGLILRFIPFLGAHSHFIIVNGQPAGVGLSQILMTQLMGIGQSPRVWEAASATRHALFGFLGVSRWSCAVSGGLR